MAEALVSAVLETVVGMLSSAALQEMSLVLLLHDAELKQRKLRDAASDAENILDWIATEGLRRRANSERGKLPQLKSILSMRNPLVL
ncbi:hypothetical protein ACS0TY_033096 [Phlomoides rotata]